MPLTFCQLATDEGSSLWKNRTRVARDGGLLYLLEEIWVNSINFNAENTENLPHGARPSEGQEARPDLYQAIPTLGTKLLLLRADSLSSLCPTPQPLFQVTVIFPRHRITSIYYQSKVEKVLILGTGVPQSKGSRAVSRGHASSHF